jgi:hypothetical protein
VTRLGRSAGLAGILGGMAVRREPMIEAGLCTSRTACAISSRGMWLRSRLFFYRQAFVEGLPALWWAIGVLSVLLGGSVLAVLLFGVQQPLWFALIGVVVVAVVLIEGSFRLWRKASAGTYDSDVPKAPILNQIFRNERVTLDGHTFVGCTFQNVTLVFEGRAPFDLSHNRIEGALNFDFSAAPQAQVAVTLLDGLGLLRKDLRELQESSQEKKGSADE